MTRSLSGLAVCLMVAGRCGASDSPARPAPSTVLPPSRAAEPLPPILPRVDRTGFGLHEDGFGAAGEAGFDEAPLLWVPSTSGSPGRTTVRVGPGRRVGDARLEDLDQALRWLADRRIRPGHEVDLILDPGVHDFHAPLVIRHIDAARLRIRGAPATSIRLRRAADHAHTSCGSDAIAVHVDGAPDPSRGAIAMLETGPLTGSWEVCHAERGLLSLSPREPRGDVPLPASAEGTATILGTVLRFQRSAGLIVEGTELAALTDLALTGDYRPHTRERWTSVLSGLVAWRRGAITRVERVTVSRFDGQGVLVDSGGRIDASNVLASANQRRGFYAMARSELRCRSCTAVANNTDGFISDHGASMVVSGSRAVRSSEYGFISMFGSELVSVDSVAEASGLGDFHARNGGALQRSADPATASVLPRRAAGPIDPSRRLVPRASDRQVVLRVRAADDPEEAGDYASLSDALDALEGLYIPTNAMVAIVLARGHHRLNERLTIDHPCAAQIRIVGERIARDREPERLVWVTEVVGSAQNDPLVARMRVDDVAGAEPGDYLFMTESRGPERTNHWLFRGLFRVREVDPAGSIAVALPARAHTDFIDPNEVSGNERCVAGQCRSALKAYLKKTMLHVPCDAALEVASTNLERIGNVVVVSDCDGGQVDGLVARDAGWLWLSAGSGVVGFGGSGIVATSGSAVLATGTASMGHGGAAYSASERSSLEAKGSVGSGCGGPGYVAMRRSTVYASWSVASANGGSGFTALDRSNLSATGAAATTNGEHGFWAHAGAVLDADGLPASAPGQTVIRGIAAWNAQHGYASRDAFLSASFTAAWRNGARNYAPAPDLPHRLISVVDGEPQ